MYEDLEGVIDMHVHCGPEPADRLMDFMEMAKLADSTGMGGFVLKGLFTSTSEWAHMIKKIYPNLLVFGGITMDSSVGGLNPHAVSSSIKVGGRIIWMPVRNSQHSYDMYKKGVFNFASSLNKAELDSGISLFQKGTEKLKNVVLEILQIVKDNDVCIATGHISPKESIILLGQAHDMGIKKMMVTHAVTPNIGMTIDEQKEISKEGAFIEHTLGYSMLDAYLSLRQDPELIVKSIKEIGTSKCVISTDSGRKTYPNMAEGMRMFISWFKDMGVTSGEISKMTKNNPKYLLGCIS